MQVEVALLGWRHKNKHIKCYRARKGGGRPGGRGEGGRDTLVHIPVYKYMNRVLPKWYKEVSSYDCTFRKGLLHGMSYIPEKKSCMKSLTRPVYIFCSIILHAGKQFKRGLNHCVIEH